MHEYGPTMGCVTVWLNYIKKNMFINIRSILFKTAKFNASQSTTLNAYYYRCEIFKNLVFLQ